MARRRKTPSPPAKHPILWIALALCLIITAISFRKAPFQHFQPQLKAFTNETAQIYCSTCHLFPDPSLLDKKTWETGALPLMEFWLGLKKPNIEKRADGEFIHEANTYPPSPLISSNQWEEIKTYYKLAAPVRAPPQTNREPVISGLKHFRAKPMAYTRATPMTTLLKIDSAKRRLYIGDALTRTLEATDAAGNRIFAVEFDSSPISLNINADTIQMLLVGRLFPSDDSRGRLLQLTPDARNVPVTRLLANLRRPTDVKFADLNKDGTQDIIICQFGNLLGRLSWFEKKEKGYLEHLIKDIPGIMRAEVHDFNKDGLLDIIVLAGQARDGIYLFLNKGDGSFDEKPVFQTHPLFGFTYFELADFNKDGRVDILAANGDNGEYDSPHKNYHGIRIFLNDGQTNFREAYFFPLYGVYKAMSADFDTDGDLDVAAVSYFPDYTRNPDESFVYLENLGNLRFKPHSTPDSTKGRWFTMDVGDLDGDIDIDIVLGSFLLGPTTIPIPKELVADWKTNRQPILVLENTLKN